MSIYEDALKRSEKRKEIYREVALEGGVTSPAFDQTVIVLPVVAGDKVGAVLLERAQFYFDRIVDERKLVTRGAIVSAIGVENMYKFLVHMEEIHHIADVLSLTEYSNKIDKLRGTALGVYPATRGAPG